MKGSFLILILAACFVHAQAPGLQAQGTFQFTATLNGHNFSPPNESPLTATGWFTVYEDHSWGLPGETPATRIFCGVSFPEDYFYPDAPSVLPGEVSLVDFATGATLALDLIYYGMPSGEGFMPPVVFDGIFTLTDEQLADMLAGRWSVQAAARLLSGEDYPSGYIRGQLTLVPEPSTLLLLGLGLGGAAVRYRQQRKPLGS